MTDIVIPRALSQARVSFRYVDPSGVSRSRYTGIAQVTSNGGDRVAATIDFAPCGGGSSTSQGHRAQLKAFLMRLQGRQNKVLVADESYTPRGSFPVGELFTNTEFNGTTGWSSDSAYSLSSSDGVLKAKLVSNPGSSAYAAFQNLTPTRFAPYVVRAITRPQSGSFSNLFAVVDASAVAEADSGYAVGATVIQSSGAEVQGVWDQSIVGKIAGDSVSIHLLSLSRCAMVDGGGNELLQSDSFDNAAWTQEGLSSVTANSATDARGQTTADVLVENGANTTHGVFQTRTGFSSSADDFEITVEWRASVRTWGYIAIQEDTGSTLASAYFDLSGSGSVGTVANGSNWSRARAFITPLGNNFFRCTLVARKTNAATSLTSILRSANGDGAVTYTGSNGTNSLVLGRAWLRQSSLPSRGAQSVAAAVATATQPGMALYVKGLPVSTAGLLLAGDWVEIDGQLKMVTASLDSDAAGLGYLQFSPPLRRSVSDNTPIIVHRPMGRFIFAGDAPGWSNEPGVFSQASIDLEEAFG